MIPKLNKVLLSLTFCCFLLKTVIPLLSNLFCTQSVWIGGNDLQNEGTFIWSKSGQAINWDNWSRGNPDDTNSNEDCIEFYTFSGKWNDKLCDRGIQFICEKDINQNIVTKCTNHIYHMRTFFVTRTVYSLYWIQKHE